MATHKLAVCACLLLSSGILSLAEESPAKPVDPKTIGKAYRAHATSADLLYKGKVLAVAGVVTAITNDHAGGSVDRVYFASQSEVNRLGDLGSLNGAIDSNQTDIWSCSFDADRSGEIAQLRRNDALTLEDN
jgi:tRNA_anti-like